jgi:GxxExxY protein
MIFSFLQSVLPDWRKENYSEFSVDSARDEYLWNLDEISSKIIRAAITVHKELGPGLLETVYQSCMVIELRNMGVGVESETPLPVFYRGEKVNNEGFRMDLLVEDEVVMELKSVEQVMPVHRKQLLTYLRLARKPLGLLINFNEVLLKDGICRIINTPEEVN